jgi:hypothetical protein
MLAGRVIDPKNAAPLRRPVNEAGRIEAQAFDRTLRCRNRFEAAVANTAPVRSAKSRSTASLRDPPRRPPPTPRLLEAIRDSATGGSPMSPEVARRVIELYRRVQPPVAADYSLTPHELRILNLLVQGENYKTTAAKLGVASRLFK